MPDKDPVTYLLHIRDCCAQIGKCQELGASETFPPSIILDAICRNLEVIGEAAGKLDGDFRILHPEIPWRQMIGARNILIHNYDGMDPDIVWNIVQTEIPRLLASVNVLIERYR